MNIHLRKRPEIRHAKIAIFVPPAPPIPSRDGLSGRSLSVPPPLMGGGLKVHA